MKMLNFKRIIAGGLGVVMLMVAGLSVNALTVMAKTHACQTGSSIAFPFGVQAGDGGILLKTGSSVTGNIHSNGTIEAGVLSAVSGNATAVGTIEDNLTVGGTSTSNGSNVSLPSVSLAAWQAAAASGVTTTG
ncbi:MAG: hypothetical protein M3Q64_02715, partial [bacterium]|nr:hypothetical protein [bacterium]